MRENDTEIRHPYGWILEPLRRVYHEGRINGGQYEQMIKLFHLESEEIMEETFCEDCGKQIPEGSAYCLHCGKKRGEKSQKLKEDETPQFCFHCGVKLEGDYVFCPSCGGKVR
jgi:RNA polymerase subunit RPABC4/transcription elongation factor Spt4